VTSNISLGLCMQDNIETNKMAYFWMREGEGLKDGMVAQGHQRNGGCLVK
jgi:hypothetical protein